MGYPAIARRKWSWEDRPAPGYGSAGLWDAVRHVACGCGNALVLHYTVKKFQAVNVHKPGDCVAPAESQRELNILGARRVGRLLFLIAVSGADFPAGPNHTSVAALILFMKS